MANRVFNIAKGFEAYYASLPASTDSLVAVLLKLSGLEADGTLEDYDTLSALLAASNDEATDASYSRQTLTSVTYSPPDDTNDKVNIDCADIVFTSLAGAAIGKLLICYVPSSGAADSAIVPVSMHDASFTPDGTTQTFTVSNFISITD